MPAEEEAPPPAPEAPDEVEAPEEQAASDSECLSDIERQLLNAHNEARSQPRNCGSESYAAVPPLAWSCQLRDASEAHSEDMQIHNFFSHTGSDGGSAGDRITTEGYTWRQWGENIAAGYGTVDSVMQGWLDSPGHCSNIMNATATEMGAARVSGEGSQYSSYWTAVFARPQ
ncbi:MAG: CAP domain-containing protein [Granulosicoccus sp.]|nr:CAP domain-containing protein [Granulosicoccus sp.]